MSRRKKDPTRENPYVTFATALNFFDPDQRKMIEHIQKRTNFSDYFKRLVLRDMDGKSFSHLASSTELPEQSDVDLSLMSGVI